MRAKEFAHAAVSAFVNSGLACAEVDTCGKEPQYARRLISEEIHRRGRRDLDCYTQEGKVIIDRTCAKDIKLYPCRPERTKAAMARKTLDVFLEEHSRSGLMKARVDTTKIDYESYYAQTRLPKYRNVYVRKKRGDVELEWIGE